MTRQRSFKRLVRTRMARTGESYATARTALLTSGNVREAGAGPADRPPLATSDAEIRRRTGRGWEQWFDLLDEWGATDRTHRDIARWVAGQLGVEPLAWNAQAVTTSYERARGLRAVGERADGFAVTVQKTVPAAPERVFDAFVDVSRRGRWLPGAPLRQRTATRPRVAHFDWGDGTGRVHVTVDGRADGRSTVVVEHARLADAEQREGMRAYWRSALVALAADAQREATGA